MFPGWVLPALLVAVGAVGCGNSERPAVVSIAGQRIDRQSLVNLTQIELASNQAANRASAGDLALNLLIRWQWTLNEARSSHATVTTHEAEKELAQIQFETTSGIEFALFPGDIALRPLLGHATHSNQLTMVKMGMLASRVLQLRIRMQEAKLPQALILDYYRRHPGRFQTGEHRDIRSIINYSRAKTLEAKREMQAGVPFRLVAKRFNQSFEGGLLINDPRKKQEKRVEKDYFSARSHVLLGPRLEILFYVFEVFGIHPSTVRPLHQVEGTVRRLLATERVQATINAEEQRWHQQTVCLSGYLADRCGSYSGKLS
jgi:hypothetical protein